ncbi:hypothetical protein [Microvirga sp. KLBC 81]|uniref:hypothetical protein n=1 Tax=Microvirga sp. KLBC 81 TaxID=1862707 RepID=UPI001057D28A|nr:hypothetical protein [Microvirga sp. KLBC 81]
MGQEWQKAWKNLQDIYRASEEAEARYHEMWPDLPSILTKTEQDWEYGLCAHPNHATEATFDADLVEQFRRKPIIRGVQQPAPERRLNRIKTVLEPWPEAQARADEIVAAWDKYRAADKAAQEQSGFAQANKDECEVVQALHELEERIARTRAHSPQGMLVKAHIAATDPAAIATVDDLERAIEERLDTVNFIGRSLILDVLHINSIFGVNRTHTE